MTGGYLSLQIRQRAIGPILAFREYIFRDVVPQFCNLDQRADQLGNEYYERAISQPADEDFDGDLSGFAEDAHDHALRWYEMMRSLRQTMLNLLAAGLFHLTEQQLASLGQDAGFENRQPNSTALDDLAKWYDSILRLDLHTFQGWPLIEELRLVANTAKHAEGRSSEKLRALRPQLFCDPVLEKMFEGTGVEEYFVNRPVAAPLAGEDLFVTESALQQYAEGVEVFFREIAATLNEHENEYY
jgi:hypothetical protein